jgi:hypothetical protein
LRKLEIAVLSLRKYHNFSSIVQRHVDFSSFIEVTKEEKKIKKREENISKEKTEEIGKNEDIEKKKLFGQNLGLLTLFIKKTDLGVLF